MDTLQAAAPMPTDIRWMRRAALALLGLGVLLGLAMLLSRVAQSARFDWRQMRIEGDLTHNSEAQLRANTLPRLQGNFLSTPLNEVREAFEAVPWVRRATVRRIWPDRLLVQLEEHRASALWQAEERDDRLVNQQGEVFAANIGDVEDEALPTFSGPEGSSAPVLSLYRRLLPLLRPLDMEIEQLQLSTRGSWRVLLDSGATLELGRGTEDEVLVRAQRFVRTLSQLTDRYRAPLEHADLRHADGYAVRLRGVTTNPTTAPAGPKSAP